VLHFESATHRATVWVNDVAVMSHEGGYTPFEADITDHVAAGEQVRITALVNNTLHWQSIPPGVIEDTPAGKRQRYWHDFFNYAGIHRNVWLCAADPTHITDVTITTDLDGESGVIDYTVDADATDDVETKVILRDAEGTEVTTSTGRSGTLHVPEVHKWEPGDGYLYDLEIQLVRGDTVVDSS
jgi:beta-glucuronidase